MNYFLRYFMARGAFNLMRGAARTARQAGTKLDYVPADLTPIPVVPGMPVLWLRPSYAVAGTVVSTGMRGIQIVVTKTNGQSVYVWVDPRYLVQPTRPVAK